MKLRVLDMTTLRPVAHREEVANALTATVTSAAPIVTAESIRLDEAELDEVGEYRRRSLDPPPPQDRWRRLVALWAGPEAYVRAGAQSLPDALAAMRPADAERYQAAFAALEPGDLELIGSPSPPMLFRPNLC